MLTKFKTFSEEQKNSSFVNYCWSDRVVKRGKQTFAIFSTIAYDVSKMKFDIDESCRPGMGRLCVSINGRFLGAFPDEGRSGIMGLYIVNRRGKNVMGDPTFVLCGWIYTSELGLSADEISDNITDEILEGKNVITTPPAGWYSNIRYEPASRLIQPVEMVKCDCRSCGFVGGKLRPYGRDIVLPCGHSVPRGSVMSASVGSSCPGMSY